MTMGDRSDSMAAATHLDDVQQSQAVALAVVDCAAEWAWDQNGRVVGIEERR